MKVWQLVNEIAENTGTDLAEFVPDTVKAKREKEEDPDVREAINYWREAVKQKFPAASWVEFGAITDKELKAMAAILAKPKVHLNRVKRVVLAYLADSFWKGKVQTVLAFCRKWNQLEQIALEQAEGEGEIKPGQVDETELDAKVGK